MKTIKGNLFICLTNMSKATMVLMLLTMSSYLFSQSIVDTHGRLQVVGNKVMNEFSQPISLAGNSLFWDNFGGDAFYNAATVNHLATEWKTDIVRPAMGVEEWNAYTTNPTVSTNNVIAVVDAAIAAGVYVIIDFHSHYAEQYQQEAIDFFTTMASTYGTYDNVIYEVFNEPINQSWPVIKSYSEAVISAIRAQDPDNLIIVGSRLYSQEVEEASLNPIIDPNVAYALHFYSGTHTQYLRDKAIAAMNNGVAIFVTEWGAVNANGDGAVAAAETQRWMDFMRDYDISHANWSVFDKDEGASVVAPNAGLTGLLNNNLTATGIYVRDIIENWNASGGGGGATQSPYASLAIPGVIQAEDYDNGGQGIAYNDLDAINNGGTYRTDAVDIGGTADGGSGFVIGYTEDGEWLEYTVANVISDTYDIGIRVASVTNDLNRINLSMNGTSLGTVTVPNTGGYEAFTTVTLEDIVLPAGTNDVLRLTIEGGGFNVNWVNFAPIPDQPGECIEDAATVQIEVEEGDVYLTNPCHGVILTSPSGQCFRVTIGDDGLLVSTAIACP